MKNLYHVKRSGLSKHYLVMQRGSVIFATRSKMLAFAVARAFNWTDFRKECPVL